MQCAECSYQLSPFDKECPRCKNISMKGQKPIKPEPVELVFDDEPQGATLVPDAAPSAPTPSTSTPLAPAPSAKMKCAYCTSPVETGWLACPRCGANFGAPVPPRPLGAGYPAPNPQPMTGPPTAPSYSPTTLSKPVVNPSLVTPQYIPMPLTVKSQKSPANTIALIGLAAFLFALILVAISYSSSTGKPVSSIVAGSSQNASPSDGSSFVSLDAPPQDILTVSGLTVSQGPPEMIGHRSWAVAITVRNNCEIQMYIDFTKLKFDDFSEQLLNVNDKNGNHNAYIGQSITPKIASGETVHFTFYADDLSDNATKKPAKLVLSIIQGEISIPISQN